MLTRYLRNVIRFMNIRCSTSRIIQGNIIVRSHFKWTSRCVTFPYSQNQIALDLSRVTQIIHPSCTVSKQQFQNFAGTQLRILNQPSKIEHILPQTILFPIFNLKFFLSIISKLHCISERSFHITVWVQGLLQDEFERSFKLEDQKIDRKITSIGKRRRLPLAVVS